VHGIVWIVEPSAKRRKLSGVRSKMLRGGWNFCSGGGKSCIGSETESCRFRVRGFLSGVAVGVRTAAGSRWVGESDLGKLGSKSLSGGVGGAGFKRIAVSVIVAGRRQVSGLTGAGFEGRTIIEYLL